MIKNSSGDMIKNSSGVKNPKNSFISQCKKVQKAPKVYIALSCGR